MLIRLFFPAAESHGHILIAPTPSGAGCVSLPHLDLPPVSANLKTRLRVDGGSVNDMAVFEIETRSVIRTLDAVVYQLAF